MAGFSRRCFLTSLTGDVTKAVIAALREFLSRLEPMPALLYG